jgi:hypothetical protein
MGNHKSGKQTIHLEMRLVLEWRLQIAENYGLSHSLVSFAPKRFGRETNVTRKQTDAKLAAPNSVAK